MLNGHLLAICRKCPLAGKLHDRAIHCTIDGGDTRLHASAANCPTGKFDGATPSIRDATAEKKLLHGLIGIAKAATGIGRAQPGEIARRRVICRGCAHRVDRLGLFPRCTLCGCLVLAKTQLASEHCPAAKW